MLPCYHVKNWEWYLCAPFMSKIKFPYFTALEVTSPSSCASVSNGTINNLTDGNPDTFELVRPGFTDIKLVWSNLEVTTNITVTVIGSNIICVTGHVITGIEVTTGFSQSDHSLERECRSSEERVINDGTMCLFTCQCNKFACYSIHVLVTRHVRQGLHGHLKDIFFSVGGDPTSLSYALPPF